MAIGRDITIPQNPPSIPPANTAKIFINGCNWFVFPYTFGPIMYPSIFGQIKHTITVKINNFVFITEAITRACIFEELNYNIFE